VNGLISENPSFADCAFNEEFNFIKINLSDPPKDKKNQTIKIKKYRVI